MKLLQVSGKRVLQSFQHSQPRAVDGPLAGIKEEEGMNVDQDGDDMDGVEEETELVESVECVGFSHKDFKWIVSGGLDKTLKVWDIVNGVCRCVCQHAASVVSLQWHSSLPLVVSAALDNVVRVWDARAGLMLQGKLYALYYSLNY